jgi:hypothetical protein
MKKIISILLVAFLGLGSFALVNADSYVNGSVNAYNGYNNNWNNWNNSDREILQIVKPITMGVIHVQDSILAVHKFVQN